MDTEITTQILEHILVTVGEKFPSITQYLTIGKIRMPTTQTYHGMGVVIKCSHIHLAITIYDNGIWYWNGKTDYKWRLIAPLSDPNAFNEIITRINCYV